MQELEDVKADLSDVKGLWEAARHARHVMSCCVCVVGGRGVAWTVARGCVDAGRRSWRPSRRCRRSSSLRIRSVCVSWVSCCSLVVDCVASDWRMTARVDTGVPQSNRGAAATKQRAAGRAGGLPVRVMLHVLSCCRVHCAAPTAGWAVCCRSLDVYGSSLHRQLQHVRGTVRCIDRCVAAHDASCVVVLLTLSCAELKSSRMDDSRRRDSYGATSSPVIAGLSLAATPAPSSSAARHSMLPLHD